MTSIRFKRSALALGLALATPLAAWSQVSLSVTVGPPPLPLYAQPPIPGDGYLWTPGYWGWGSGLYVWHPGYWGPHVGYYGGINYGYGYIGSGYAGGRWDRGRFRYNSAVNNIPQGRVHDVYRTPVPQRPAHPESFNGGKSPWHTPPTANERRFEGGQHPNWTQEQTDHEHRAVSMPEQRMGNNHGTPPTAATPRPGGFGDPQVEHVRQAPEMRVQPVRSGPGARPEAAAPRGEPRAEPRAQPQGNAGPRPGGGERGGRPDGDRR